MRESRKKKETEVLFNLKLKSVNRNTIDLDQTKLYEICQKYFLTK